ncbi:MAG: hypothetical protein JF609_00165 [Verrucomicrobia bacterium]|nr:hypothetical protein [Verrucomicrobiota bacterium]
MLIRILLIVAIIAGLGAGGLGYYEVSTQIPALKDQRDKEHTNYTTEQTAHKKTTNELKKTAADLASTQQELSDTKDARDKAVARADAQQKRADELSDKLAKAVQERDDAQNLLASYKATDLTPDQVVRLNKQLKDATAQIAAINGEKALLQRQLVRAQNELKKLTDLMGKVVVVDPKWDFVVVNVGDTKGAREDGELLVSRDGKLVAKVIIKSVQSDRCIANVVPGWKLGEMIEGDTVTPAHPSS